jgi:hypothetical protein
MQAREQRPFDSLNESLDESVRLLVVRSTSIRRVPCRRHIERSSLLLNSSASSGCSDSAEPNTSTYSRWYPLTMSAVDFVFIGTARAAPVVRSTIINAHVLPAADSGIGITSM